VCDEDYSHHGEDWRKVRVHHRCLLRHHDTAGLTDPVGGSPTVTGGSPVLPKKGRAAPGKTSSRAACGCNVGYWQDMLTGFDKKGMQEARKILCFEWVVWLSSVSAK
jgi:hypothetical protein